MNLRNRAKQSGFTLVEIAIVLVIIGLLLGGVLKGQEMVNNAKIKNLNNDMNGVVAAHQAYRERYGAMPGDDLGATTAARGWVGSAAGGGDGLIGTINGWTACAAVTANEECLAWRHLRHAGFIGGDLNNAAPSNAYGGLMRVQQFDNAFTGHPAGLSVCATNVPAKGASGLDILVDDGSSVTGSMRGVANTAGNLHQTPRVAAAAIYDEAAGTNYTVCKLM